MFCLLKNQCNPVFVCLETVHASAPSDVELDELIKDSDDDEEFYRNPVKTLVRSYDLIYSILPPEQLMGVRAYHIPNPF